ncbi:MAG: ABC transporter ATP-binding protein [Actinobacteria bacterium]|nr:ABC transporter ATP-binding protein [Actinomycetota bacterium]
MSTSSSLNGSVSAEAADHQPAVPALTLAGVSVRFGGIAALSDVSLRVAAGTIHGVMGPNGAGKTTLFDVVSGVRRPSSGSVALGDVDVTTWSTVRRARHGMRRTFQRVQVFGRLSVADNLLLALEHHGGGGGFVADFVRWPARRAVERRRREVVATVAERCGLTAVLDRKAGALPIGIARQVELARALIDQPRVLLLDEPTSGLDEAETERLSRLIRAASTEHGCAVVLVEHDVHFMMSHCAQVTVLDLGRVIADATPDAVQNDPAVRAAYLD